MGYVKIDHRMLTDMDTDDLSDEGFALLTRMKIWSSREETDGKIPPRVVRKLGKPRAKVELLLTSLCSEVDGNLVINGYLDLNTSKASIEAKRAVDRDRKAVAKGGNSARNPKGPSSEYKGQSTKDKVQSTESITPKAPAKAKAPKKPKVQKWNVVPADWSPTAAHAQLASGLRVDLNKELQKFRDWEFKDPKVDADRAFNRWLRSAAERSLAQPGYRNAPASPDPPKNARQRREDEDIREMMAIKRAEEAKSGHLN